MPLCNLYSITKGQQAIRDIAGAMRDLTGNMPMLPGANLKDRPDEGKRWDNRPPRPKFNSLAGHASLVPPTRELAAAGLHVKARRGGLQLCL